MRSVLGWFPQRAWFALSLVFSPLALGIWGAAVAGTAAWLTKPGYFGLAALTGSISASFQLGWITPAYCLLARHDRWRWPIWVGALLGGPLCGYIAALAVLIMFY